jgi:hypothetical protein
MAITSTSRYKDQDAVSIESEAMCAQYLPGIGATLCSLVYKPLGLQLLIQRPEPRYRVAPYAGDYVAEGECAGLDDMFPTIDRCYYDRYPWQDTPIPDHGEVWSIPWQCVALPDRLRFSVYGVRFPYRLEKEVHLAGPGVLRTEYRLTNLSNFAFDFLWSAHPMFVMEEDSQVLLPEGVRRVTTVFSNGGELGGYGEQLNWPVATLPGGMHHDLSRMRPKTACAASKYFVDGRMPAGWCALTYPQSKLMLTLRFPVEQVPYLAILPNEGGWQDLYNIFLEPATASFDRPDVARMHGELSTVPAGGSYQWYLELALSPHPQV